MLQGTQSSQYSSLGYPHHLATDLVFSKEKNIKENTIWHFHLQAYITEHFLYKAGLGGHSSFSLATPIARLSLPAVIVAMLPIVYSGNRNQEIIREKAFWLSSWSGKYSNLQQQKTLM